MRVAILCEFSGIVRDAFSKLGHEATSYDLLPSIRPGQHVQGDVMAMNWPGFDLVIAHPPCTHLAVSGARWFKGKEKEQGKALDLVRFILNLDVPMIALENPVSIISTRIRRPDQIIHPWQFGHPEAKTTCLWLKNLPDLKPTKTLYAPCWVPCGDCDDYWCREHLRHVSECSCDPIEEWTRNPYSPRWENQTPSGQNKLGPSPDRWKNRSKTYQGIADAMAKQWGGLE